MAKKLWYGVVLVAGVLIGAGGVVITSSAASNKSPTGFSMEPILKPTSFPMLTRDQLITRGHADDKLEIEALLNAYQFFHDTHNGKEIASLFVKGGTFEHLYNNGGKTLEPNPGPTGRGCMKYAPDDILKMYTNPIPFPAQHHNEVSNLIVQVYGDTASFRAHVTTVESNEPDGAPVAQTPKTAAVDHSMQNVADLQRTADGWRFTHLRVIQDFKSTKANADPPCTASTR